MDNIAYNSPVLLSGEETSLIKAIKKGESAPEIKGNINALDQMGNSAIFYAAWLGMQTLVAELLERGADPAIKNPRGLAAIDTVDIKCQELFQKNSQLHVGPNKIFNVCETPLFYETISVECVQLLINERFNCMYFSRETKKTPLICATQESNLKVVSLLIDQGVDLEVTDQEGKSVLMNASSRGESDLVKLLLDNGADLNAIGKNGYTALEYAIEAGQTDVAKFLLDKGALTNRRIKIDRGVFSDFKYADEPPYITPLILAAQNGHDEIISSLVEKEADLNATDIRRKTALMWAARSGKAKSVETLLNRGAKIGYKCDLGNSALEFAVSSGCLESVRILTYHGAELNPNHKYNDLLGFQPESPLEIAVRCGYREIAVFLINQGAKVTVSDIFNHPILMSELVSGSIDPAKVIKDKYDLGWFLAAASYDSSKVDWRCVDVVLRNRQSYKTFRNCIDRSEWLIQSSLDFRDGNGWTLLMHAVLHGDQELVHALVVENKADIEIKTKSGLSALDIGIKMKNLGALSILKRRKKNRSNR